MPDEENVMPIIRLYIDRLTWGEWAWVLRADDGREYGHGICATYSGARRVGRQVASELLVDVRSDVLSRHGTGR